MLAEDTRALVAKATSIDERLELAFEPLVDLEAADQQGARRLEEWRNVLVGGDHALFLRRLEWDGLDESRMRRILGEVRPPEGLPLPAWVATLEEALETSVAIEPPIVRGLRRHAAAPLPFEEVLAPFAIVARRRLQGRAGEAYGLVAGPAHQALEDELYTSLARYSEQALFLEFSIARATLCSPLQRLLTKEGDGGGLYERFVEEMRGERLGSFFAEYAVLARQLATVMDCWVDSCSELFSRLMNDWRELEDTFAGGRTLHRVTSLETGLSDPHRGRRGVVALTFDEVTRIVYKPRDLGIERTFQDLLVWLNEKNETLDARVLRVATRDGYGWTEFVDHRPCLTREEAKRYFQRSGTLLCLVYLLEGVDCHRENVIAQGEYPVLIDCEALMQPRQRLDDVDDVADAVLARYMAYEQLSRSVLRSGLLPAWKIYDDGKTLRTFDVSALGGLRIQDVELKRPVWTNVNTDQMEFNVQAAKIRVKSSGAMLYGKILYLEDWAEDTIRGFRQTYVALMRHREALLADDGSLARMARQPVRFIYRDTQVYGTLCQKLMAPEYQRDGVSRSIQLDLLCRVMIPRKTRLDEQPGASSWWPIAAVERRMMQSEDIPFYEARPTQNLLVIPPGREIPDLFQGPSYDLVVDHIRRMDDADLERQVGFILGSVYTQVARPGSAQPVSDAAADAPADEHPNTDDFIGPALAIAEEIARRAIRSERSATWIGAEFMYYAERYQLQPLNNDLYTGVGGVVLFLAAASRVAGSAELRKLALAAATPLRDDTEHRGPDLANAMGLGGARGLGSLMYVFTTTAKLLGDDSLLAAATTAAALVSNELIAADTTFDVFEGAAGAILGLLSLHDVTRDPVLLERAHACGRHMVGGARPTPGGHRAWITLDDKMLAGFSHGAAGIAYALLRLYSSTGADEYLELARDAIAYEDSLFNAEVDNWLDMRGDPLQKRYTASWCHGAPGIALGRLGGLAALDDAPVRHDIEAAIRTMTSLPIYDVDYVCCGNLGIHDILLTASRKLARPGLATLAAKRSQQVVARAQRTGAYALDPLLSQQVYSPNFFQGAAGIGYTLLRQARPNELPSVLMFE